jgi:uncharacterized protein YfaS (alpha-2-macroglobulin family)
LALWAVANYLDEIESVDPAIKVQASIGSKTLLDAGFRSFTQSPLTARADLGDIAASDALSLSAEGSGSVWATVKLSQAPKEANLDPEASSGLIVSRTYSVVKPAPSDPGLSKFSRGQVVKIDLVLMTPDDRTDLVVEDVLPAGFEPVNFNLKSEDQTLVPLLAASGDGDEEYSNQSSWPWYSHQQIWPDKVAVFADYLPAGVYNFSYLARPATPGLYKVPGPKAEGMYEPEAFGRGRGHVVEITP